MTRPEVPDEPIRLVNVIAEGVTLPPMDGSRGSALYRVPVRLSRQPSARWAAHFVEAWNHPREFSSLHRPGIASVVGDRVILDGTTLDEVERYHRETLLLAVEDANQKAEHDLAVTQAAQAREEERRRHHVEVARSAAERIKFD